MANEKEVKTAEQPLTEEQIEEIICPNCDIHLRVTSMEFAMGIPSTDGAQRGCINEVLANAKKIYKFLISDEPNA